MKLVFGLWIFATVIVIGFAGFMAYNNKEGWGWFLFVGVLMAGGCSYKEKGGDKKDKKESELKS